MELRHLVTFETVLKSGTFLSAARALGYSQSTVTLHIQELEKDLGIALFAREGKRVTVTEAGRLLQTRARQILDGIETLRRSMSELEAGDAGELRVGSIEPAASCRLSPLLARFCRPRPALRVSVEVGGASAIARRVADSGIDLGLSTAPEPTLGLGFEPLFVQRMGVLLPRRHPLARLNRLKASDLGRARLLLTDPDCAYRQAIQRAFLTRGTRIESSMEISSVDVLKRAVRDGLGVAIVPLCGTEPAAAGTVLRGLSDLDVSLQVGLVRRPDAAPPTRALGALIDALRAELGEP